MRSKHFAFLIAAATGLLTIAGKASPTSTPQQIQTTWRAPDRLQRALAMKGESRTAFEGLLQDSDPNVRLVAANTLSIIGSAASIEPLIDSLHYSSPFARSAVLSALVHIGPEAALRLLERTGSRTDQLWYDCALALLVFIGDSRISTGLQEKILTETRIVRCDGSLCVKHAVSPVYSSLASLAQITGNVLLSFSVDSSGHAVEISAAGPALLTPAAVVALKQFEFENSSPETETGHEVTMEFQLLGRPDELGTRVFEQKSSNYFRFIARHPTISISAAQHAAGADR